MGNRFCQSKVETVDQPTQKSPPPSLSTPSSRSNEYSMESESNRLAPPVKPKRTVIGQLDPTVQFEDGTKLAEYGHFGYGQDDGSSVSSSSVDSELGESCHSPSCKFTIVTETQVEDKATYMSETDEYYADYPPSLTRRSRNRVFKASPVRPRSNSSTLSPTVMDAVNEKWRGFRKLQQKVDSAISTLNSDPNESSFQRENVTYHSSRNPGSHREVADLTITKSNLQLENSMAHKNLEDTRKRLYSILDDAFFMTSDSGIEMMSKSITSAESAPPIDPKFYENLFAAASTPPPELNLKLRRDPPDDMTELINRVKELRHHTN